MSLRRYPNATVTYPDLGQRISSNLNLQEFRLESNYHFSGGAPVSNADLCRSPVAVQSQYRPPLGAHDLGINTRFEDWSPEFGWWLEKRIRALEGFATPTGAVTRHL